MIYDENYWKEPCPRVDCRKKGCLCGLKAVTIPSALGDDSEGSEVAPKNGAYCNAIVKYETNGHIYIYSKEGIPTRVNAGEGEGTRYFDELFGRPSYAGRPMTSATSIPDVSAVSSEVDEVRTVAESALQPEDINYTVLDDLGFEGNPSTSILQMDASLVNLQSGTASSRVIPFPVASTTQAGVMNSATFDAITNNTNNINALLNGAVAVANLPAAPTQAELTTAWQTETGLTTLINRAQILDSTNSKIWTYYTNDSTWHEAPAGGTVSINTFTNSSEGVIKGSTNVGQIFAENDGTGSVNGWDSLSAQVTNNTNYMLRIGSVISQPTSVAYVDTANIIDEAVTGAKVDFSTMKKWVPDYAQKSSTNIFSSGNSYTVTQDGFMQYALNAYRLGSSVAPTATIKINDEAIIIAESYRDYDNNMVTGASGVLPVSNGDTISLTFTGGPTVNYKQGYFIPGKWA